jgi:hypothetical protein
MQRFRKPTGFKEPSINYGITNPTFYGPPIPPTTYSSNPQANGSFNPMPKPTSSALKGRYFSDPYYQGTVYS